MHALEVRQLPNVKLWTTSVPAITSDPPHDWVSDLHPALTPNLHDAKRGLSFPLIVHPLPFRGGVWFLFNVCNSQAE